MGDLRVEQETIIGADPLEGYRETEIGPLPENWKVVQLGEVADIQSGYPFKSSNFTEAPSPTTYPVIRIRDVLPGRTETFMLGPIDPEVLENYRVDRGDILIGMDGNFNTVQWPGEPGLLNQRVARLRRFSDHVSRGFVAHTIVNPLRRIEAGKHFTTVKHLSINDLRTLAMPLPPLSEQKAIAHVLRTIQKAIESTEQVIEATRELKRSLMNHLFTYGPVPVDEAEQVPLKETEIGPVPEHWDMMSLGEVATVGNGSTPKRTNPAYWDSGTIPWLTSGKVHETIIRQADNYVTEIAHEECHLPIIPAGSIVVAITGQGKTLGHAALVAFDTSINQHLAYLKFRSLEADPEFVLAYLDQRYDDLRRAGRAGGSTKAALTCRFLKNYPLPFPPLKEQLEVARTISGIDNKIVTEENRKHTLEILFKTLLHNLMTGKLRVKDLDLYEVVEIV